MRIEKNLPGDQTGEKRRPKTQRKTVELEALKLYHIWGINAIDFILTRRPK